MIPTVFVIGAGVSVPFDFPAGDELVNRILGRSSQSLDDNLDYFINRLGLQPELVAFRKKLAESGYNSIDRFLQDFPQFLEVGKCCIARELIPFEQKKSLFNIKNTKKNAYHYLWNNAVSLGDFERGSISFVTFNYDRCLEEYFWRTLCSRFGDVEARQVLDSMAIVHVYGQLGSHISSEGGRARSFDVEMDQSHIKLAADGIKIIGEERADEGIAEKISVAFKGKRRIVFLGFGFRSENLELIQSAASNLVNLDIYGSAMGMAKAEKEAVESDFEWQGIVLGSKRHDAVEFMREEIVL